MTEDVLRVITIVAMLRTITPKLDGWIVVALVALLSAGAGFLAFGKDWPGALEHGTLVFVGAFGGWNAVRRMLRELKPATLADAPKSEPPKPPPLPLVMMISVLALAGCVNPLQTAAAVANGASDVGHAAEPVLESKCDEPMAALAAERRAALAAGDHNAAKEIAGKAVELAKPCDPAIIAYESLRVAHVALRAAIVVAASGGNLAEVAKLVAQVSAAAAQLGAVIVEVRR